MASLKKEVKALISRFDAAQDAFMASSAEAKAIRKQHKKELKSKDKTISALRQEIEDLRAELSKAKIAAATSPAAPAKKTTARRKTSTARKTTARSTTASKTAAKKATEKAKTAPAAKKATPAKKTATAKKPSGRRPGRPRKKPAQPASALQKVRGIGPSVASAFEDAGIKTPAQLSKASNAKITEVLNNCGPRYRNPIPAKIQAFRDAANDAK